MRFRGKFAYITGQLAHAACAMSDMSASGIAIYRAGHDDYQNKLNAQRSAIQNPEGALECARGLYLADLSVWLPPGTDTPADYKQDH